MGKYVECLITPRAFITFGSADSLPKVTDNINPQPETVELLFTEAQNVCREFLTRYENNSMPT